MTKFASVKKNLQENYFRKKKNLFDVNDLPMKIETLRAPVLEQSGITLLFKKTMR